MTSRHAVHDTLLAWVEKVETALVGMLGLAALAVCLVHVVLRNFGSHHGITGSDEIQVYLVVWAIFLSLGLITARNRHIKVDVFLTFAGGRLLWWAMLAHIAFGCAFSLLMVVFGVEIMREALEFGDTSATSLRFPLWIYYAALPVGSALMAFQYLLMLALHLSGAKRGDGSTS